MSYQIHESSYVDKDVSIGDGTRIWHFCHIQKGAKIGKNCTIGQSVNISNNVLVGNNVKIQNNVSLYEGVELEDYVFCGPSMVFTNDLTPRSKYPKDRINYKKTLVKYGASIGANATIICGTTIGRWAMIASGAVVTKDVPDYALMAGIPAKQIGWVCECGQTLKNGFKCLECGREYILIENKLKYKNFRSRGFKHKKFIRVDFTKINYEKIKEWKIYKEVLNRIDYSTINFKRLIKSEKNKVIKYIRKNDENFS